MLRPYAERRVFWGTRWELEDRDFGLVTRGPRLRPDPLSRPAWRGIVVLPDDVAVRTAQYQGSLITRAAEVSEIWSHLSGFFPLVTTAPKGAVSETSLMVSDELEASLYLCVTGWYRQAFDCLRTAFEQGLAGPYFDLPHNAAAFADWRRSTGRINTPSARTSLDQLAAGSQGRRYTGRGGAEV